VARTKFLAKVASGVAKPDGLLVVPTDRELAFLHPLPVEHLWGVGPVTANKLQDRGIATVGEVAMLAEAVLISMLGRGSGRHLHALAHNRDPRPVQVGRRRGSIGSQHALGRSPKSPGDVDAVVVGLVDRVTRRMRTGGRVGRTVTLRLRFNEPAVGTWVLHTAGGLISEGHLQGMGHVAEAVRQIRGTSCNQVADVTYSMCTGYGGAPHEPPTEPSA
jgi:DNA polymerase-4